MIQQFIDAHQILKRQLYDTHLILISFRINNMVANPGKFQIMFPGSNNNNKITFMIENEIKLVDITIDNKLSFTTENSCSIASNHL